MFCILRPSSKYSNFVCFVIAQFFFLIIIRIPNLSSPSLFWWYVIGLSFFPIEKTISSSSSFSLGSEITIWLMNPPLFRLPLYHEKTNPSISKASETACQPGMDDGRARSSPGESGRGWLILFPSRSLPGRLCWHARTDSSQFWTPIALWLMTDRIVPCSSSRYIHTHTHIHTKGEKKGSQAMAMQRQSA